MRAPADVLAVRGVTVQRIRHARATSGLEEAEVLGVPPEDVVKAVVIRTDHGDVLAVVPASRRLDMRNVRDVVGDRHARLATEDEIEDRYPAVELGALPPLGSLLGIPTFVDPAVLESGVVVFAAGTRWESDRTKATDLFHDEPITVASLTRHVQLVPEC